MKKSLIALVLLFTLLSPYLIAFANVLEPKNFASGHPQKYNDILNYSADGSGIDTSAVYLADGGDIHYYRWWHATCQHVAHDEWNFWRNGVFDPLDTATYSMYADSPSVYNPNLHSWRSNPALKTIDEIAALGETVTGVPATTSTAGYRWELRATCSYQEGWWGDGDACGIGGYERVVLPATGDGGEEEPPPPPPLGSPVAVITAPLTANAGDTVPVNGLHSCSPNGAIVTYNWSTQGASGSIPGASGALVYMNQGTYNIGLTITDEKGATGSTSKNITILPPYPVASLNVSGSLKENRKITADATGSTSSTYFPIDWSRAEMSVLPLSGGTIQDIKYNGGLNGYNIKDLLIKRAGTYKVILTVFNSAGLSNTAEKMITIAPDQPPVALFNAPPQILRDPDNNRKAAVMLTDQSSSPDGDIISNRKWEVAYDSNNDGSFTGETYTVLDNSNKTGLSYAAGEVGKYLFRETVTESFGQATIPEFIVASDYKSTSTNFVVEVINTAPVSALSAKVTKKVDLSVVTDYAGAKLTDLTAQLNTLRSSIFAKDVDLNFTVIDGNNKKQIGEVLSQGRVMGLKMNYGGSRQPNLSFYTPAIWVTPSGTTSTGNGSPNNIVSVSTNRGGTFFSAVDANGNLYGWGTPPEAYLCPFPTPAGYNNTLINFNGTYSQVGTYYYGRSNYYVKDALCLENAIVALGMDGKVEMHGNTLFRAGVWINQGTGYYYGANEVVTDNVKQLDGRGFSILMLKNDGTVWGRGENQYYAVGPSGGRWTSTWSGYPIGRGFMTGLTQISGLPPIKKIMYTEPLLEDNQIAQTSFAIDYDNRVWAWGYVLPGTGITPTDGNIIPDGQSIGSPKCIKTPQIIQGLNGSDIDRINFGSAPDGPIIEKLSYAANTYSVVYNNDSLFILKKDGTLWSFKNGTMTPMTSDLTTGAWKYSYYKGGKEPGGYYYASTSTPISFNKVAAIDSNCYLTEDGIFFGVHGSNPNYQVYHNGYETYVYLSNVRQADIWGIPHKSWLTPVYAPNLDDLNTGQLRPGSDRYFLWVSDGQGNDFISGYGNYFGLGNLTQAFADKLKEANYEGIIVAPDTTYSYLSGLQTQELTLQNIINKLPKLGQFYPAGQYGTALNDLQNRYTLQPWVNTIYAIVNEDTVAYNPQYSDYEVDPKNMEAWYYAHNPNYFENSQGSASFAGQWMATPVTTFDKVGQYSAKLRAQDNPKNNSSFMNYWLWGNPSPDVTVIVHRRPVADFSYSLTRSGSNVNFSATNISYDLDHLSQTGQGIAASRWRYKLNTDSRWTLGIPASLTPNLIYNVSLEVQDLEGAWSYPAIKNVDTGNLPPLVDANPTAYDGGGPVNVTVTADDQGENDFAYTRYAWSQSTAKPAAWSVSENKVFNTPQSADGAWYLHMEAFDISGNSAYVYRGPYRIITLAITGVSISGYWNHWRGQVDMFGKRLTNEPHRFLSLETVKIDVTTTGHADRVAVRFSPELEAMRYTDRYGNVYDYRDDYFGSYVRFPADSTFTLNSAQMDNSLHWEYKLPLAPSSVSWEDERLRSRYSMTVTAYKEGGSVTYTVNDIDITGNVYDLTYIQPLH